MSPHSSKPSVVRSTDSVSSTRPYPSDKSLGYYHSSAVADFLCRLKARFSSVAALSLCIALLAWVVLPRAVRQSSFSLGGTTTKAEELDQRLQQAATLALGDRRGAVIVMDPQAG